ncbi:Uncharacterised protein [Chlamydia abortus]|nr:Uncharacterised protein [Chlamydia abortus]SGA33575.1 Uncharacterised protein [Chlamydia abortus]
MRALRKKARLFKNKIGEEFSLILSNSSEEMAPPFICAILSAKQMGPQFLVNSNVLQHIAPPKLVEFDCALSMLIAWLLMKYCLDEFSLILQLPEVQITPPFAFVELQINFISPVLFLKVRDDALKTAPLDFATCFVQAILL